MAFGDHHYHRPSLLSPSDPPAVTVMNPAGTSPFLFIGDHAGNVVPASLGTLGLGPADRVRHIAWDIGIGVLGSMLAAAMNAVFLRQTYSRLVIDCNRDPGAADAMPAVSDGTPVPGNQALPEDAAAARIAEIHEPYHLAIAAELARRTAAGQPTILIALHSFTPALSGGPPRPWHIGVLHHRGDTSFASALLETLRADETLTVGDNEPYRMDGTDYTVPRHAYPTAIPYAELEIRQDLLADEAGCARWTDTLRSTLEAARLAGPDNAVT